MILHASKAELAADCLVVRRLPRRVVVRPSTELASRCKHVVVFAAGEATCTGCTAKNARFYNESRAVNGGDGGGENTPLGCFGESCGADEGVNGHSGNAHVRACQGSNKRMVGSWPRDGLQIRVQPSSHVRAVVLDSLRAFPVPYA